VSLTNKSIAFIYVCVNAFSMKIFWRWKKDGFVCQGKTGKFNSLQG
jgi:hypothetical protein